MVSLCFLCYLYIPTGIPWDIPEITEITGIDIPWYHYVSLFLLNMKESPWPETVTSIPVIFSFFQSTWLHGTEGKGRDRKPENKENRKSPSKKCQIYFLHIAWPVSWSIIGRYWEYLKKQNVVNIWIILNCCSGSSRFKSKVLNILCTSHGQSYAARDCLSCARSSMSSAGRVVTGLGWFIMLHGTWGCHDYNGDLVVQEPRMMIKKIMSWWWFRWWFSH